MKLQQSIIYTLVLVVMSACSTQPVTETQSKTINTFDMQKIEKSTHKIWVSLTVAESKRLIARGLTAYPPIIEKMKNGVVVVTKGTTNTYVAEEMLEQELHSGDFVYGHILPAKGEKKVNRADVIPELVFYKGKSVDMPFTDALQQMNEGDIVLKGGNILNYEKGQAGVCIGHPTAGTIGKVMPAVEERNLRLIIPIGLEKCTSQDIDALQALTKIEKESIGKGAPWVWSLKGELFTEIEAIKQMADVEVVHLASGGIGGAEGAVSLMIFGGAAEVAKAQTFVESVQGESPYLD